LHLQFIILKESEVTPYNNVQSKREQVESMFDNIAPYYDFLNRFLSLGIDKKWRTQAISLINSNSSGNILDVATGTGDIAIEIGKTFEQAKVIGVDISAKMLEVGKKKIEKSSLGDRIHLELGDSQNLSFDDNTFDTITVAYGVRNFEELEKGLNEMKRVLKDNGQLIVLEFSRPTVFPLKQLFNFYFKNILPTIGKLTSKDPKAYKYLYESVQAFPDGQDFIDVLDRVGFKNSTCTRLTFGISSIYQSRK